MTMNPLIVILFFIFSQAVFCQINVQKEFEFAANQYQGMLASHPDMTQFPQSTKPDGSPNNRRSNDIQKKYEIITA